jgi:hypothetical protein
MDVRTGTHRWLSPTFFALIALCFFLPFATVSCDGASTTFTGVQLVTDTVPHGGFVHEGRDCSADISVCAEHDGAGTATLALAMALVGVLLGLLGIARGPGWCAAIGAAAMVKLSFAGGFLGPDIYFHSGYELALLLFVLAWCLHIRRAYRRARPRSRPQGPLSAHLNALLLYGFVAYGSLVLAGGPPGLERSIGSAGFIWLALAVAPTWLGVAVALQRWRKAGRPDLLERAARWDALLWLGPLLPAALIRDTRLRTFLTPLPSPIPAYEPPARGRAGGHARTRLRTPGRRSRTVPTRVRASGR